MLKGEKYYSKCDSKSKCKGKQPEYKECEAHVKSRTLPVCPDEPMDEGKKMKVPIVLLRTKAQVNIESDIELEEKAIEIKRIKKNVFVTQCKVIPTYICPGPPPVQHAKVFLGGYVRKNIEYATADCIGCHGISGDIKHTTVNVPFECVVEVNFNINPVINPSIPQVSLNYLDCKKDCNKLCDEPIYGVDPCETTTYDVEVFNEPFYCELEKIKIIETDLIKCAKKASCRLNEMIFRKFTEKLILYIDFKILQKQQKPVPPCDCHDGYDC